MSLSSVQIDPRAIVVKAKSSGKQAVLRQLGEMAAESYGLNSAAVTDRLGAREDIGSTGFGKQIAIPHARFSELKECVALVMRLDEPVAFDAHDSQAVDLFFCLLSPENSGARHLQALAEVSRYLRDEDQVTKLRGADSEDAIFVILSDNNARQAA